MAGRGVVGQHPVLTPDEPIFMVSLFCIMLQLIWLVYYILGQSERSERNHNSLLRSLFVNINQQLN